MTSARLFLVSWRARTRTHTRSSLSKFQRDVPTSDAALNDGKLQIKDGAPLPFNPTNTNTQIGFNISHIMAFKDFIRPSKGFSSDFQVRYSMYVLSV